MAGQGWNWVIFKVPSNPNHSMILRFCIANLSNLYCPSFKAKYHTPVAVYCGSIPKFKPRYIALRGGSIDSNLQFCGSKWTTEEEGEDGEGLNVHRCPQPNEKKADFREKCSLEVSPHVLTLCQSRWLTESCR